MKCEDAVRAINFHRNKLNLQPIKLNTRPSYSAPGKTTMEIFCNGVVMHKSTHWGAIIPFLKGMLMVFEEKPAVINAINTEPFYKPSDRKIEWR